MKKLLNLLFIIFISFTLVSCTETSQVTTINSLSDLEGKKIGVILGSSEDLATSSIKDAIIERFNSVADEMKSLSQGKLDCVVVNEGAAKSFLEKDDSLSVLDEAFAEENSAICVSKNNPELKEKLNTIIAELKEEGIIQQVLDNYLDDEKKGTQPYVSPDNVDRSNGTFVVATNAELEPYEYIENGKYVGIEMELAQAIADKLGMKLQIEDMQFTAIINAVQSGKADVGFSGMVITEERKKSIDFTDPIYEAARKIVVYRNGKQTTNYSFIQRIYQNFITENRYQTLLKGLGTTLIITLGAEILALVLGTIIAYIRYTADKLHVFYISNLLMKLYLTVIRGTPSVIQLLIIYYVIFANVNVNKILICVVAFGLNSAAYVAEIIRSGWNSVGKEQYEAGRSLGFTYRQTMRLFIFPQAIKNIIPALGNEFIGLLKGTAIAGYIGIVDLTRAGDYIRSRTYEALIPLVSVALIYLVIVIFMSLLVSYLERRLNQNEKR